MKLYRNISFLLILLFCIHTGFAEIKPLSDQDMREVTGQTGVLGRMVGFSEAFASTGKDGVAGRLDGKTDLERAVPFNLAYVQDLRELGDNVRKFDEIFERVETEPLEDGWTYFEASFNTDEPLKNPGEQLTYEDAFDRPVETGLGILSMGGFKVERSHKTRIHMTGRVKVEFRP